MRWSIHRLHSVSSTRGSGLPRVLPGRPPQRRASTLPALLPMGRGPWLAAAGLALAVAALVCLLPGLTPAARQWQPMAGDAPRLAAFGCGAWRAFVAAVIVVAVVVVVVVVNIFCCYWRHCVFFWKTTIHPATKALPVYPPVQRPFMLVSRGAGGSLDTVDSRSAKKMAQVAAPVFFVFFSGGCLAGFGTLCGLLFWGPG